MNMYRVIFILVILFVITLSGHSQKKELDEEAYEVVNNILEKLKLAVIDEDKELVEKYDEVLTDILFRLR